MWTFKDVSGQTNYIPAANVSQVAPGNPWPTTTSQKINLFPSIPC